MSLNAPAVSTLNPLLTEGEIRAFRENGFLVVPRLIDKAALQPLQAAYDRFLTSPVGGEDNRRLGGLVRQVMYPHRYLSEFADNPARRAAQAIARQLLGEEPEFFYDMLLSKEPGDTQPTVWHQDHAYESIPYAPAGTPLANDWIQFWVALDPVDEETGCMNFIPGSHHGTLRAHYVHAGDPQGENRMLATDDVDGSQAVSCPLPAGGCTLHSDGTLHYTSGNRSRDRPRRAYIFSFRAQDPDWLR